VQAAKLLGAGRVVAAGRDPSALQRATQLGADATVVLGGGDDSQALSSEAGEGFDEAPSAWQAQADGPHQKLVIAP
jgi:NADPH2:quinone reductase